MIFGRRLPLLIGSACAAALLSAGLVAAQTASPPPVAQPATPPAPAAQPPGPELPPQEIVVPPATPEAKPSARHAQPDDQDDQDDKAPKKDGKDAKDDGVEAKDDSAKPVDAIQRQVHGAAVIQALDKITAETMRFEIKAGQSLRWKGLVFTLRSCQTSAPNEPVKDSIAYLLVRSDPRAQSTISREIFHGWMFASSPGLNPLKSPVYDAWLISCRA